MDNVVDKPTANSLGGEIYLRGVWNVREYSENEW